MALLSRNAGRLFWAARYLERAEDTARLVLEFGELFDDMPTDGPDDTDKRWAPLLAVCGDRTMLDTEASERDVVRTLVCDRESQSSVAGSIAAARANLRTTREVLPREAWHTVNDLSLFADAEIDRAESRRFRSHVLGRVTNDSRRLEGIITSSMTRDAAWHLWRIGRYIERADMTTRVVGVRAAVLMSQANGAEGSAHRYDEVQWMGVLKSLSALQMYQRATRGTIEGSSVVRFLLFNGAFPRSVRFCLGEIDRSLDYLGRSGSVRESVEKARTALMSTSTMETTTHGADLDQAMDWVQSLLGEINEAIADRYLSIGTSAGEPDPGAAPVRDTPASDGG